MKELVLYIHGKDGCAGESDHYNPLFPECEVVGLDYQTFTPRETGKEIREAVTKMTAEYDSIALNTIIRNKSGTVNSCDLMFSDDLAAFNKEYLTYTNEASENCADRDLSADSMVIGTSAIIDTEIDGAVNMYSGFNNPFLIWGKYRKKFFRYYLPISFQFHHTQMDGAHAGRFLENLQKEMNELRKLL